MFPAIETQLHSAIATAWSRATVLVVDDDQNFRRLAGTILDAAGFAVLEAGGVGQCLRVLGGGRVDVIVLDIVMPGRDGIEGLRDIRRRRPGVKVVTVSGARSSEAYLAASAHLGADASLDKAEIVALPALLDVLLDH